MKITYYGAFIQNGCTVKGIDQGAEDLSKIYDFKHVLYEEPQPEENKKNLLYENTVCDFLRRLKTTIQKDSPEFPVVIGGDHSLAIGSVSASCREDISLIWIDAHGDHNTPETTISGRIHGMPVAVLEGLGSPLLNDVCEGHFLKPENIFYFGLRSLDPQEEILMKQRGVHMYYMKDIREKGSDEMIREVTEALKGKELYISLDLDCMDPSLVPGVSIPEKGGLRPEEVYRLLHSLFDNTSVIGMDFVEYNPLYDVEGKTLEVERKVKEIIEQHIN